MTDVPGALEDEMEGVLWTLLILFYTDSFTCETRPFLFLSCFCLVLRFNYNLSFFHFLPPKPPTDPSYSPSNSWPLFMLFLYAYVHLYIGT